MKGDYKMTENRFKARQQKRAVEEESRLEQAKGVNTPAKQNSNTKMVPVQFYMTDDMKKRLKMYCLSNDTKMTEILNAVIDDFLKSKGF